MTTIPPDLRFYIVNAPGDASYPISGFTWVVVIFVGRELWEWKGLGDRRNLRVGIDYQKRIR